MGICLHGMPSWHNFTWQHCKVQERTTQFIRHIFPVCCLIERKLDPLSISVLTCQVWVHRDDRDHRQYTLGRHRWHAGTTTSPGSVASSGSPRSARFRRPLSWNTRRGWGLRGWARSGPRWRYRGWWSPNRNEGVGCRGYSSVWHWRMRARRRWRGTPAGWARIMTEGVVLWRQRNHPLRWCSH